MRQPIGKRYQIHINDMMSTHSFPTELLVGVLEDVLIEARASFARVAAIETNKIAIDVVRDLCKSCDRNHEFIILFFLLLSLVSVRPLFVHRFPVGMAGCTLIVRRVFVFLGVSK